MFIYGQLLMEKVKIITNNKIVDEQCGFREDRGCVNQVFTWKCSLRRGHTVEGVILVEITDFRDLGMSFENSRIKKKEIDHTVEDSETMLSSQEKYEKKFYLRM